MMIIIIQQFMTVYDNYHHYVSIEEKPDHTGLALRSPAFEN